MPALKEVRIRIASVNSTQQITSAMKMVAASKLRRAQNAILKLRPYAAKLKEIMQNLSADMENSMDNKYADIREPESVLLIAFTSNKGLCGAFNANVIRAVTERIHNTYGSQPLHPSVHLITVGRKATDFFRKRQYQVVESWDDVYNSISVERIYPLAEHLMSLFTDKTYDRIELIYNQFKNAAVQRLVIEQYLPIAGEETTVKSPASHLSANYIYEPDKETLFLEVIPKSLRVQLFKAILDSYAAEMGAV